MVGLLEVFMIQLAHCGVADLLKLSKTDYDRLCTASSNRTFNLTGFCRLLRSDDLQSIKSLRDFLITVPSLQSLSVDTVGEEPRGSVRVRLSSLTKLNM